MACLSCLVAWTGCLPGASSLLMVRALPWHAKADSSSRRLPSGQGAQAALPSGGQPAEAEPQRQRRKLERERRARDPRLQQVQEALDRELAFAPYTSPRGTNAMFATCSKPHMTKAAMGKNMAA